MIEILAKARIVRPIAIQSKKISIKAIIGIFRPKKITDHRALRMSCNKYKIKAILTAGLSKPFCQTIKADKAMSRYSIVQTGPNSQSGGVNKGLLSVAYQSATAALVNIEPIKAAEKVKAKQTTSFITMESFITVFYQASKCA